MVFLPHWPIPHHKLFKRDELDITKELLRRLGDPHLKLPPVIHVAGTNGKGSVCAYLTSIMQHANYKVHRYTSPHLIAFNERIMLRNMQITDAELYHYMECVRAHADDMICTIFTATTVAAFLAFSEIPADVLILEVGMGGLLDQTNVISTSELAVITPIALDHIEFLGNDIATIAKQKSGIIKPNGNVVSSWQYQDAISVIANKALDSNATLYAQAASWDFTITETGFDFIDLEEEIAFSFAKPSLFGVHQYLNAATAVAACRMLPAFDLQYDDINNGIKTASWPCRMENITSGYLASKLPSNFELWLDGAHNAHGAEMIAATIKKHWHTKPIVLINGRTFNRDIAAFLKPFYGIINSVYGVRVQSEPSAENPDNIANCATELGFTAHSFNTIDEAVDDIIATYQDGAYILIAGSLFLAADVAGSKAYGKIDNPYRDFIRGN